MFPMANIQALNARNMLNNGNMFNNVNMLNNGNIMRMEPGRPTHMPMIQEAANQQSNEEVQVNAGEASGENVPVATQQQVLQTENNHVFLDLTKNVPQQGKLYFKG